MEIKDFFSKSIYYPAGGTDLQVLLRLSDISNIVISPTLSEFLTIENYQKIFKQKCEHLNNFYNQMVLKFVGSDILPNDFIVKNKFIQFPIGLFSEAEKTEYFKAFSHHFRKDNFVVKFNFIRTIGNLEREVSWIAMNTEGVATLVSLVELTRAHPKIFCTIQSGILEYPNSLFVRLLNNLQLGTKIWIRGFWDYDLDNNQSPIFSNFPPFPMHIQTYGFWYSPMGEGPLQNEENDTNSRISKVRAFGKKDFYFNLNAMIQYHIINGNNKILLIKNDINTINAAEYDLIITSEEIFNQPVNENVKFWGNLTNREDSIEYPILLFVECLKIIRQIIQEKKARKIAITTLGYEDETCALCSFSENLNEEFELHIYYIRPLDFLNLKAPDII